MPNISFDIFYNTDLINFTISRSGGAPRAKPDWKIRQAPKLAPKPKPTPENTFGKKPSQQKQLPKGTAEVEEVQSEAGDVPQKAPKLTGQANGTQQKKKQPPKLNQANGATGKQGVPKINKEAANTLANQG